MTRNVDYQTRRKQVLASAIRSYIQNAMPVASEDIAPEFELSSATIRNIFSELEESGLLTHLYTSGGRIPTDKGYRYYVDLLLSKMELLDNEKEQIIAKYRKEMRRMDDALEETSEIISNITHYAGIVSLLEWQDRFFYKGISRILEHPEFKDSTKIRLLIKFIEDKERLLKLVNRDFNDKVKVYIGHELECPDMEDCSLVVSSYRLKDKRTGRIAVLGPARMEYNHIIPTLEYISETLTAILDRI
ncbi:MAG: hypothetical protein PHG40_02990 [Candidatus Omnitrophica bacterium]|nr:hypothetical protein [Candidatus Omnitrophota bacterium]